MNTLEAETIAKLWQELKAKKADLKFAATKVLNEKSAVKVKILALLNSKIEPVSQMSDYGFVVLNQTILSSHDRSSVAEQGFIGNDFFKARVMDVDNQIIKGLSIHLVKMISGIITNDSEHEVTLSTDENFCQQLFQNKLIVKLLRLFLIHHFGVAEDVTKKIKVRVDQEIFSLKVNQKLVTRDLIFQTRDVVNQCLENKRLNYQKYPFLKDELTKAEKEQLTKIELVEIKNFSSEKNKFSVDFLVGSEKINDFLNNSKKELFTAIKIINQKIKLLNQEQLSELSPELTVDSYEKLEQLQQDYRQLKDDFTKFQNDNPELMRHFIDDSIATQYFEKIGDYQFVHINFNNLLLDEDLLAAKANEIIQTTEDQIVFLSNNNLDNASLIVKLSPNLISKINIVPLVNQFANSAFKEVTYPQSDSVFVRADNFQVVSDFIRNIINFFKISNNQTI